MNAPRYVIDTSVFIELARGDRGNARVRDWLSRIPPKARVLCPVVAAGALLGISRLPTRPAQRRELRELRRSRKWDWLDITEDTARRWAAMIDAAPVGRAQKNNDAWIAAVALQRGAVVLTRDLGDFAPYGVPTVDPWEAPFPA